MAGPPPPEVLSATISDQAIFDNSAAFTSVLTMLGSGKDVVDVGIPASSTDYEITVGIPNTSEIKAFLLRNAGTIPLTVKFNSSEADNTVPLAAGEAMSLAGPGVAKAVIDLLSGGASSLDLLSVTNTDPDNNGRIQYAVFYAAPIP